MENLTLKPASGHRLLPHTADMGVEAWAKSLEQLFIEAALGLREVLFGEIAACGQESRLVCIEAGDLTELLVAWLNELLYRFEVERLVPAAFQIEQLGDTRLCGRLCGERYRPDNHPVEHQVKAATYHQAELTGQPGRWRAKVYLDL